MDRALGNTSLKPQKFTKLHPEARLNYGKCEAEHLLYWLSGHPASSSEYTYSQFEDQAEAHTIAQMSQITRRESSPSDLGRLKLPYETERFFKSDEDLSMLSADTKEPVCGRATPASAYSSISSNSPSEVARRSATISKVLNHDFEPSQEPNQPSDAMRAVVAKAIIRLLTEEAKNGLAGLPEGYHRSHAIWLTSSLPLAIESKEVSHPDNIEAAIDAVKREGGDEFTLMRRKAPAGESPNEAYQKDVLWTKRWIEDWSDMLYINPQKMRILIDKNKVRFFVSKTVAKCYDGRWFFHRPLDKNQLSTWELLLKRVRDGGGDDVKEEAGRGKRVRV